MAPKNESITLVPKTWTRITEAGITRARVQNQSSNAVWISGTAGDSEPPENTSGSFRLIPNGFIGADTEISGLWPGVENADCLWAWSTHPVTLSVSHA